MNRSNRRLFARHSVLSSPPPPTCFAAIPLPPIMLSNEPIERLLNATMALDSHADHYAHASEMRCLLRKIEWVAQEAETALKRLEAPQQCDVFLRERSAVAPAASGGAPRPGRPPPAVPELRTADQKLRAS